MKTKNLIYSISIDDQLFKYKCSPTIRPFFQLVGWGTEIEIPLNITLFYKRKSFLLFRTIELCVNHYHSSQKFPAPRKLRSLLIFSFDRRIERRLLAQLDRIIGINLAGGLNMALVHINSDEIARFYSRAVLTIEPVTQNVSRPRKTAKIIPMPQSYSQAG